MFSLHFAGTLVWGTKAPRFRLCMNIAKPSYLPLDHPLLRPKLCRSFLRFWVCLFCCSQRSTLQLFLLLSKKKNIKKCILLFFRLVNVQLVQLGFGGCFKLLVLGTLLGRGEFGLLRLNWSVMLRQCYAWYSRSKYPPTKKKKRKKYCVLFIAFQRKGTSIYMAAYLILTA